MGENDVECGCMMCLEDKVERQQSEISQLRCELHEAGRVIASLQEGLEKAWAGNQRKDAGIEKLQELLEYRANYAGGLRIRLKRKDAEIERLRDALEGLLLSADCAWEARDEGHDWAESCRTARAVLKGTENGK